MISVIIPTLNEEKYLEYTLKTIRNQTYKKKFEIIVADSMSKDGTVEIAKEYADKVISVKKRTVGAGRNAGAKATKSEILIFLDADTIVLPNLLETIEKVFKEKKVVAGVPPLLPQEYGSHGKNFLSYLIASETVRASLRLKKPILYAVCMACRKKVFEKVGGFDEDLKVCEDIDFGVRLKDLGKMVFMDDTVVFTSTRRLKKWGYLKQLRKWPLGYFDIKYRNKKYDYKPIR